MSKPSPLLALLFGVFLAVAELARNWGNWQWWPFWLVDFIAAALLLAGGTLALRGHARGAQVLAGAWGFTSAMFYVSFWSHIEHIREPAEGNLAQRPLTVVIGVLWLVTVLGFAHSLLATRESTASHAKELR